MRWQNVNGYLVNINKKSSTIILDSTCSKLVDITFHLKDIENI